MNITSVSFPKSITTTTSVPIKISSSDKTNKDADEDEDDEEYVREMIEVNSLVNIYIYSKIILYFILSRYLIPEKNSNKRPDVPNISQRQFV